MTAQRIGFRIWFIAVCLNTVAGTTYLAMTDHPSIIGFGLFAGFCFSGLFSLPIFLVLVLTIRECAATGMTGLGTLLFVLMLSVLLTALSFFGFKYLLDLHIPEMHPLFFIAVFSGVVSVLLQAGHIMNPTNDSSQI